MRLFEREGCLDKIRGMKHLFIDEVQDVEAFEEAANGFRAEGGFSILITGSNSCLLSGELAAKLTGRYVEFEVQAPSFREYREMKRFLGQSVDPNPVAEPDRYILEGGFPKVLDYPKTADKRAYVQVAMTIVSDRKTEDRECRPLEQMRDDRPKSVITRNDPIQRRGGIVHENVTELIGEGRKFGLARVNATAGIDC